MSNKTIPPQSELSLLETQLTAGGGKLEIWRGGRGRNLQESHRRERHI